MILTLILGGLSFLSLALLLWQWIAAARFPLHQRSAPATDLPGVTLLKPLKGCDDSTEACLRSWFDQDYPNAIQLLFAVASDTDPVCRVVEKLRQEFPERDADLIVVSDLRGANAKVSKLAELERLARHEIVVVSDADVRVPRDFLVHAVTPLSNPGVSLVNCFYRLANPLTLAMHWEAIAINADFWSQVLQSKTLKPLDFALGAVMATRRARLREIGGFASLVDCLADDYQLGNRIARKGHRIELCSVVVECWDPPMGWAAVWKHQLRWARTIRVCQPAPYFFSILSNAGLWALLWLGWELAGHGVAATPSTLAALALVLIRVLVATDLQRRVVGSLAHARYFWLVPLKDLLQGAIWLAAFAGNRVEWRGQKFKLRRDGTLIRSASTEPPAGAQLGK